MPSLIPASWRERLAAAEILRELGPAARERMLATGSTRRLPRRATLDTDRRDR